MNPLLKLILKGIGPTAYGAAGPIVGPQIPDNELFNAYQDSFDASGDNATRNRTIKDILSLLIGEGVGMPVGSSIRPNPIAEQFYAGMGMAGAGQGSSLTPEAYQGLMKMRRDAQLQMSEEAKLDKMAREKYADTERTWSDIEEGVTRQIQDLNAATARWRQQQQSLGRRPSVTEVATFRKQWLSDKPNYADVLRMNAGNLPRNSGMSLPRRKIRSFEGLPEGALYGWGSSPMPSYYRY